MHFGADEFVSVPLEDHDVLVFYSCRAEAINHFEHQLGGRVGEWIADRVHLDADDVARFEETSPGLDRVGGAGELFHAARNGFLDRRAVLDVAGDHSGISDFDDAAGKRAGDAKFSVRYSRADSRFRLLRGNKRRRHDGQRVGCGTGSQELATAELLTRIVITVRHEESPSSPGGTSQEDRMRVQMRSTERVCQIRTLT